MKQIEHALKRVRVIDAEGAIRDLTAREFNTAVSIAARTYDVVNGCQLAVSEMARETKKSRSTIKTALSELVEIGVIQRAKPVQSKWETHFFWFDNAILDAAKKSRPYKGGPIFTSKNTAQISYPNTPLQNANICNGHKAKTRMKPNDQPKQDGQQLDGQLSARNCIHYTAPPPRWRS